jgi:hypothetical protein
MDGHGIVAARDVRWRGTPCEAHSVWTAYGWDDCDPASVDDKTILT